HSLFYTARTSVTAPHRVFRATRSDRDAPFAGGEQLASWPGLDPIDRPWGVGDELFFNFDHGDGNFELASSRFDGATWSTPESLGPDLNSTKANSDPTLTADGRYIFFSRAEATGTTNMRLYQAKRSDGVFGDVREVAMSVLRPEDVVLCATVSPDGLHLFFATSYPHDLSSLPPNALTVWLAERRHVDHDWSEPIHLSALDATAEQSCPSAVSGDGCELWVQRFVINGPTTYVVARR
ncbi:MAG TPA: hypothetical protein VFB62_15300, partial [Polyangiaceae bacterium]|nr:hypothetical protein [Polyangiaceae bacterium]